MRETAGPIEALGRQRSHVLLVHSNGTGARFLDWYLGAYKRAVSAMPNVLSIQQYELHEVDITQGRWPRLPFKYLSLLEISVDGADAAAGLIESITTLHKGEETAQLPATWLYYPASERVGCVPRTRPSMLMIAFANAVSGMQDEFREWYATRHIRHAMRIATVVSGQYLERTAFQKAGALDPNFDGIAIYEQEGAVEDIVKCIETLPGDALRFPAIDPVRFSEAVYRPI